MAQIFQYITAMNNPLSDTRSTSAYASSESAGGAARGLLSYTHIVRDTLLSPRRWLESWYGAYAILGAVSSGIIPITLPLMMSKLTGELSTVGFVMGAFNLGAITSPLWGNIADRTKKFRLIFFTGLAVEAMGLALFPLVHGLLAWFLIALAMGTSTAAVSTCATLMVVEFHPADEWTPRIGWLQTFNGAGQSIGLLLAGILVAAGYRTALWTGAAMLVPAIGLGIWGLRRSVLRHATDPTITLRWIRSHADLTPIGRFARVELLGGGVLRHFSIINIRGLKNIGGLLPTRFGRFIASIFIFFFGIAGFFAYFPIFLKTTFHIDPSITSVAYAVTAGVGVALYALAGKWSGKLGAGRVYFLARVFRLLAFTLMLAAILVHNRLATGLLAFGSFSMVILAWPVISVSATELTSELSPISQGMAQGLYNAANAVGTVLGTYLAGAMVGMMGFKSLPILAVAGILLSILIDGLPRKKPLSADAPGAAPSADSQPTSA
ncbi:MAG: MFS transporter [Phycisphaerae bacterium]